MAQEICGCGMKVWGCGMEGLGMWHDIWGCDMRDLGVWHERFAGVV